jgi:hypothetical protein
MKIDDRKRDAKVQQIAREILWIETLDVRNSDRLDLHELGVGPIRAALVAAYEAGRAVAKK